MHKCTQRQGASGDKLSVRLMRAAQRSRVSCAALLDRNDLEALPDAKIAAILPAACGVSYTRLLGRGIAKGESEHDRTTLTTPPSTRH